jgi:NDP-sugar pyrophosphorylase family protein
MLTIVMPLSGRGRAFIDAKYTFPKPLIEIAGRPLIEIVIRNLTPSVPHRFVFVCRAEHLERFAMRDVLSQIAPGSVTVPVHGETGGALCSVLLASEYIGADDELIVANGDQYITRPIDDFVAHARASAGDGCIVVFPSTHPKWSYVRTGENGDVDMVAEKRPISKHATAGIYYFRKGADFLGAAERMLLKGTRTANEYYLAPTYNELILDARRVTTFPLTRSQMVGLGTPEDVEAFMSFAPSIPWLADADA